MKISFLFLLIIYPIKCFAFSNCIQDYHPLLKISNNSQYECIDISNSQSIVATTRVQDQDGFAFLYLINKPTNRVLFITKQFIEADEVMPTLVRLDKVNYGNNIFGFDTARSKPSGVDQFIENNRILYEVKNDRIQIRLNRLPTYIEEYHQGFLENGKVTLFISSAVKNTLVILPVQDYNHARILINSKRINKKSYCNEEFSNCKEKKYTDNKSIILKFNGTHYVGNINDLLQPLV